MADEPNITSIRAANLSRDLPHNPPGGNATETTRLRYRQVRADVQRTVTAHRPDSRYGTRATGPESDLA